MTETWTDGYVADIEYTHGFYPELTPARIAFALLLKGLRAPALDRSFAYGELGCGQGFSSNLLAAANPNGTFWGTDFNPSHAAGAKALAEAAGTPNVSFRDQSFAEALEADTPVFDFVGLHGVYSWISPENRHTIVEILRRKLAFGGVVYISYNCLPGWSAAMPLRQLMIEHAAGSSEPMVGRIDKAIAFASRLKELNAGYFAGNPGVGPRLEKLVAMSRNYLAHEYFNRDWTPQYFSQVAQELSGAKLSFAASAHLADHIDMLNLSADAQAVLAGIGDPLVRETVRDFFVNQQFRRDLFVKGAVRLSPAEQQERLRATTVALLTARAGVPLKASFLQGEVTLQPEVYAPVLDALADGPCTVGALLEKVQPLGLGQVVQALTVLAGMGHVAPGLGLGGLAERRAATDRFNLAVLDRARFGDELQALASPVTGGGIPVDRIERLFLLARRQAADPVSAVWSVLSSQNQRLVKDGKALATVEENMAELAARHTAFVQARLPVLEQLGVS